MAKLFIAKVVSASGPKPLVTVRAAGEGEAKLFLEARYPDDVIEAVVEPADWVSEPIPEASWETSANIPASNGRHPPAWQTSRQGLGDGLEDAAIA